MRFVFGWTIILMTALLNGFLDEPACYHYRKHDQRISHCGLNSANQAQ
jgi:hypothetical protein